MLKPLVFVMSSGGSLVSARNWEEELLQKNGSIRCVGSGSSGGHNMGRRGLRWSLWGQY